MFDDHARGFLKTFHAFPCGVGVGDVVVAQFLALQLKRADERAGRRVQIAVVGCPLVWVLAITQVLQLDEAAVRLTGKQSVAAIALDARQVVADGAIVLADAVKGGHGKRKACFPAHLAIGVQFGQYLGVLRRIGQHRHVVPVLGRAAHHRRPADVDVLDRVLQRAASLCHRGLEGIQVNDQQIDRLDAVRFQRAHMRRQIAPRQQPAMYARVQGLDPAIQHFGEPGQIGHFRYRNAIRGQQAGGAAGGENLRPQGLQRGGEFNDAGLVGNRNECVHHEVRDD